MSERPDIWKVADAIQMDLRAAQAKLVELRMHLASIDIPNENELKCDRCGLKCRGPVTLAEHLYVSHDGPVPAHYEAIEARAVEPEAEEVPA